MRRSLFSPAGVAGLVAVVLGGAIFGFFYAWVCSTMWGLDQADPRIAIAAMQAMNASVRNAVFCPAFFLTPVALLVAAAFAHRERSRAAAATFAVAAVLYIAGGLVLTLLVNVPMNEELAAVAPPRHVEEAERIWEDYSGRWQVYNQVRTVVSGVSLLLGALALRLLGRAPGTGLRGNPRLHGRCARRTPRAAFVAGADSGH